MEMLVEGVLFVFILLVMSHVDVPITLRDIAALLIETLTFFGITGFAVTTLVMRLILRGRWMRAYSIIAVVLFLIHFEIMNRMVPGGVMEPHARLIFRFVGSCLVFIVAFAISLVLGRLGGEQPNTETAPNLR